MFSSAPARGDATVTWDSDNGFVPSTVDILTNQTVTWWDYDLYGLDVPNYFAAGLSFTVPNYTSAQVIFQFAGTYAYHSAYGDIGTVIVVTPPALAITSPAGGAVFPAPATFTVQASASETPPDAVSDVQFFLGDGDGTNLIADVTSPPYSFDLTNLASGAYTLIALASDSYGFTATNAITVTVSQGAAISLGSPRIAAGHFLFDVTGLTDGKTNIVQVSTNLASSSWSPIQTNVASGTAVTVTNAGLVPRQFFRVVQQP